MEIDVSSSGNVLCRLKLDPMDGPAFPEEPAIFPPNDSEGGGVSAILPPNGSEGGGVSAIFPPNGSEDDGAPAILLPNGSEGGGVSAIRPPNRSKDGGAPAIRPASRPKAEFSGKATPKGIDKGQRPCYNEISIE